ncbi:MAG TPA: ParB N-terminal domain-containing protein [Acidisoma sp.]|jgi:hypothetical protein|nr:ParB N-terminal domain-containing protein [Acidisoma sp.]
MNVRVQLRVDQIVVPEDRLRAADPLEVDKVAASMADIGQLQDIEVRSETAAGKFPLNIGLHRLLAAQKNQAGPRTRYQHAACGSPRLSIVLGVEIFVKPQTATTARKHS